MVGVGSVLVYLMELYLDYLSACIRMDLLNRFVPSHKYMNYSSFLFLALMFSESSSFMATIT